MSNVTSLSAFKKLESHRNIRTRQVFCPVTKISIHTTPLTVGDDLSLRTMITSPDLYDMELASLIFDHCKFPDLEKAPTFDQFITSLSVFDRRAILWGIFSATYEKFEEQDITCPNCKHQFKDTIKSADLLNADFVVPWDKEKTFSDFELAVVIEINDEETGLKDITFNVGIPTIKHHFDVLKLVSPAKMKENFEKFGQILSRTEELVLITKQIDIHTIENASLSTDSISGVIDIHKAVHNYISLDSTDVVVNNYNDEFIKYNPTFYKEYDCTNCGFNYKYTVK
jgi:hypothetical protein